jgi:single-stranded DNA-specific DHH superfamily exonuclease
MLAANYDPFDCTASVAEVPELALAFQVDDLLSLHAIGAYTDQMLTDAVRQLGKRCFEELQGIAQPVAPTHKPAPAAKLSTGFGKDVRRVLV